MEERKRTLPPGDGSKTSQSYRKKIKIMDDLVNSAKKKKKGKEHDIHDEVVQKQHAIPDDVEEDNVNDVKEKLHPHKYVKYIEDCSSQYDDDDSDYYPSSQDSQVSLLEMGIRRIESVYKEERRKEKNETSSGVINKQEPEVEGRRKEELEVPSTMINKQKPEVEQRIKEKNET